MKGTRYFAALLVLLIAGGYFCGLSPISPQADSQEVVQPSVAARLTTARYFQTGQWRADARTLVAALDFLLTREGQATNQNQVRLHA